jgi:hypothetical protein
MSIVYDFSKDVLYYSKSNNDYVINSLYNIIDLPKDMCRMIGEYYNCIRVELEFSKYYDIISHITIDIDIKNEYIDFKHVVHKGCITNLFSLWAILNFKSKSTILDDNYYELSENVYILNEYMKRIYKINNYFTQTINKCPRYNYINISTTLLEIKYKGQMHKYDIIDPELFLYLIHIIKSIIDVYYPYKNPK